MRKKYLKMKKKVIINKDVTFSADSIFEGKNNINANTIISKTKVGFATYIGQNCNFINTQIGKFCSIANNVKTVVATHPTNKFVSTHPAFFSTNKQAGFTYVNEQKFEEIKYIDKEEKVSVLIGNDVWIGENVTIMGGISIGDGSIIGANTLVTKDIEPYTINVGTPSRILKYRFNETDIEFLKKLEWWNKPEEWIIENKDLFENIEEMKEMM